MPFDENPPFILKSNLSRRQITEGSVSTSQASVSTLPVSGTYQVMSPFARLSMLKRRLAQGLPPKPQ